MRKAAPAKIVNRSSGKTKKCLLFTGGGGAGAEALNRLLGERYEVHFADADIEAKPYSVASSYWHLIPFASDVAFTEDLHRLCLDIKVDLLIPSVDEELLPISQARETIGCEVLLPPTEFVRTHLDKLTSNYLLQSHGLPVPRTERLLEHQHIPFPCIAKPRQGRGSRGVAIVHSEQELQAHVILSRLQPNEFIVQELLHGQEYTVMMAADRAGRLRAVVPVKVGVKRGITLRAETDHDKQVIAACVSIHAAYPVPGCYNIQLVKSEEGDVKPFEINPRISTTACLGVAAGVDFVDIYLKASGEADCWENSLLPFRERLGLKRSWHNEFVPQVP